jgi:hypothetical protein
VPDKSVLGLGYRLAPMGFGGFFYNIAVLGEFELSKPPKSVIGELTFGAALA